jgi:drug/metabolite transporter (DMT)-like permease
MDRDTTRAHLDMLLRALILGLSFTLVGLTGEELPPLSLTAVRFAIGATALLPSVWRASEWLPSRRAFLLYSILGACQSAFFGAMFWTAHRLSALTMAVLYVTVPFLTYSLGVGCGMEQPSARLLGTLALGAAGALGLAWAGSSGARVTLHVGTAEAAYFVGCVGLAVYAVVSRWGLSRGWLSRHAAVRTFWSVIVGAVLIGALALIEEKPAALAHAAPPDILLLVYLGAFSTGGTFWLMQRAAAVLSPAAVTAYSYAPPFVSMLLLFAKEPQRISWRWLPGAVLVVLAMGMLIRRDAHPSWPSSSARHEGEPSRRSE